MNKVAFKWLMVAYVVVGRIVQLQQVQGKECSEDGNGQKPNQAGYVNLVSLVSYNKKSISSKDMLFLYV